MLFYLVFRAAGFPGLVLLRLFLLFLIAFTLYRLLRYCGLHPFASLLLVFVGSLAVRLRLAIRPELLSFVLLLAVMGILIWLQAGPRGAAYALLPVQMVWTNVHASFVFGIGLAGLVLLANLLPGDRTAPGWGRLSLDRRRLRHLAAAVACLPVASLINPQGAALLFFPFRQNRMVRLTWFAEWKPVWFFPRFDPAWLDAPIVLGLVLLAFAVTAVLLWAWEGRFDPVGWGIVLFMGTYSIFRLRAIPHFVLAVLPLLALALVRVADHLPARGLERPPQRLERLGALACLLVLSVSIVGQAFLSSPWPQRGFGVQPNFFPEGAAAFLERYHLDGRVFNTYEFGGYLLWRRWPANQVFIDGQYDGILFDEALLEEYIQTFQSPAVLDRIVERDHVDILVLDARPGWMLPYIGTHPDWARVYWDRVAEVYVRRGGRFAQLVATHEYRLTRSELESGYLTAYRGDPDTWARALAELRRAAEENPENVEAWLGLAQEYRVAGPAALEKRVEALTRAQILLDGDPLLARVHAERAEALLQLGRLDEATAAARESLRVYGDQILPHWVLALIAERRGAWQEARDQFQRILARLEPGDPRLPSVQARLNAVEQHLRGEGSR